MVGATYRDDIAGKGQHLQRREGMKGGQAGIGDSEDRVLTGGGGEGGGRGGEEIIKCGGLSVATDCLIVPLRGGVHVSPPVQVSMLK